MADDKDEAKIREALRREAIKQTGIITKQQQKDALKKIQDKIKKK